MNKDAEDMAEFGSPTAFACPSCNGALWEFHDGDLSRYRCHTGHAFSPESLLAEQSYAIEEALYSALRALEEKATALRRLAAQYARLPKLQSDYELRANETDKNADFDPQPAQRSKRILSERLIRCRTIGTPRRLDLAPVVAQLTQTALESVKSRGVVAVDFLLQIFCQVP
jgi:hypothetical protein